MRSRREFIKISTTLALGTYLVPQETKSLEKNAGVQLYSVRKEMLADATGTLKELAKIGYKELESARSEKGNYYGLKPKEIRKISEDLGMTVRSGHVLIDKYWQQSIDEAAETGQNYLICSSLPSPGQTIENYEKAAETFNKAAEDCKKQNLIFGYHNHEEEFEKVSGQVLYDILLDRTDPNLVKMEMDLGWLIISGNDPKKYFEKYPHRFPLWHLKDMNTAAKQSTEFGKGNLDIRELFKSGGKSGMKYFFIEQEEYTVSAFQSLKEDLEYLKKL
jgi:sugar phosphate isomerase/epimerase